MTSFPLHPNYEYVLNAAREALAGNHHGRVLDYGCGAAQTVQAGIVSGVDIYGCEVFYDGDKSKSAVESAGLLGTRVRELLGSRIPFPDAHFDVVVSNQVFEHVHDIETAVAEIRRVLKPSGVTLHLFPSSEVWREGHTGIPFLHWWPAGSTARYHYAVMLRTLGFGYWKDGKTAKAWAEDFLRWLDTRCVYRRHLEIVETFGKHFNIHFEEPQYLRYRLQRSKVFRCVNRAMKSQWLDPVLRLVVRKWSGLVLYGTPKR